MTTTAPSGWARARRLLPLMMLFAAACNGDSTDPNIDEAFIGNWVATSFIVDGVEWIDVGSAFNISFGFYSDGSYQLIVGGDELGVFCETQTACNDDGDFSFSGNVITLDPGTVFELDLQYSVSGDTLTVSGNLDGQAFSAVFQRT